MSVQIAGIGSLQYYQRDDDLEVFVYDPSLQPGLKVPLAYWTKKVAKNGLTEERKRELNALHPVIAPDVIDHEACPVLLYPLSLDRNDWDRQKLVRLRHAELVERYTLVTASTAKICLKNGRNG